ncbi:MAG: MarR family transcriptional regulator [Bacteroidota bacterium]
MKPEDKPLKDIYIFHLEKAFKQFKKYKTQRLKQAGIDITSDQWILLKSIHEEEGLNQRALAEKTFKEPASITRILDILEKKNWVERRSIENNRRTYGLYMTKAGSDMVKQILPLAVEIRAEGTKGISPKEVDQFSRLLIKLFENFS